MDPLQHDPLDKIDIKSTVESAFLNCNENTSGKTKLLNESFTSGSCTLLEDIDTPSSFNSSTICVEKILSISDESSQDSKDKIVEISSGYTNDSSPRALICNDNWHILAESEKVLEALNVNKTISKIQSSPISKLNFLDLDDLNDSLLADFTQFMSKENELQDLDGPSMSTPKNTEKGNANIFNDDCKTNLNFNGTFDKGPAQKESDFSRDEKVEFPSRLNFNGTFDKGPTIQENPLSNDEILEVVVEEECRKKIFNTTYDNKIVKQPVMNVTFEAGTPKKTEEPLNKTFEAVGNGSFIIDGQCTTLMDMESNALDTVLGSSTNTPVSRGIRSYPDVKKLDKSTLKKRLSMLNYQLKDDLVSTITESSSQTSTVVSREESGDKTLPSSKVDSQNMLRNQLTKEQILNRLRKNSHPASSSGVSGPMKAVPIPSVYNSKGQLNQIQKVEKRATSTPSGIQKEKENQLSNSGEKDKLPSLPSFGSVSSIGTDGPNSKDICSDDFMATPEVFRHRNKSLASHITSTPTLMTSNLKFGTDLGLGSVPTPILPPKAPIIKPFKTEMNINNSYGLEFKKERLNVEGKGRLSFATSSEGGSPDSVREENKSEDKVINMVNDDGIDKCVSFSKDTSRNKTMIKEEKNCDDTSKQTFVTAVDNLGDICEISIAESRICGSNHSAADKDLKDVECDIVLTSTAKEGIEVQRNRFSNYINEAEKVIEQLNNITAKDCSENDHISAVKNLSLGLSVCSNELPNVDCTDSVKDHVDNILPNTNEMIGTNEELRKDKIHNSTNEINLETVTNVKSVKNQRFPPDCKYKNTNTINKTLESKEVKSTSRASLSRVTNSANQALNSSRRATAKSLASTKRLSQPSTKVEKKLTPTPCVTKSTNNLVSTRRYSTSQPEIPAVKALTTTEKNSTPSVTKSANSRVSTMRYGSQPARLAVKPLNTTERNLSVKKPEALLKQGTQTKITPRLPIKPQHPRPVLKSLNTRTLPTTKVESKLQNSVSNLSKLPPNSRLLPTPKVENNQQKKLTPSTRTLPTPKVKNIQQKKLTPNARTLPAPKVKNNQQKELPPNARTLPAPKVENNQQKELPLNARTLPAPKVENNQEKELSPNARTLPSPKVKNNPQKLVLNQSKVPLNKIRSSLPSSKFTFSSSDKENNPLKSHDPRKSFIGSGIRPTSTRTGIPLPRAVNYR